MKDSFDAKNPGDPIDEELLRYALDGDPFSQEAKFRVDQDPSIHERLQNLMRVHEALSSALYRSQCPPVQELSDYCAPMSLNLLSADDRMHLAGHINICPLCTAEVAAIRHELVTNNLFPDEQAVVFSPQRLIRRLVAVLQPSQPQFATRDGNIFGTRGMEKSGWPRHYKAETLDLSLHLSHSSNGELMLLGLFTSTNPHESIDAFDDCPAELYDSMHMPSPQVDDIDQKYAGTPFLRTTVDDLGNLIFKPVSPGDYTMIVHLPGRELVIEGIAVSRE